MNDFTKGLKKWVGFAVGASAFAVGATFAAAVWWGLPAATTGTQISSSAWTDIVGQINSIAGAVTVDGTHLATTLPTASNHVATKAYVDAAAGGGSTYMGLTAATYNGNLWGFAGANAKCQISFAGSHMCSVREIVSSNATTPLANYGWTRFESYATIWTVSYFDGMLLNGSASNNLDCYWWTSASTGYNGLSQWGTYLAYAACNGTQAIHCCK